MDFTPKSVNLYSKSLHQVSGVQTFYPLEIQVNHEDANGYRVTLVILYDYLGGESRSHFLDSLGLSNITSNSALWELEDMQLDLAEMVGSVCSYFTYYGCPTEMTSQDCSMDQAVFYVVLTDIHHLAVDQLNKINEIGGGKDGAARVDFALGQSRELKLAYKDG